MDGTAHVADHRPDKIIVVELTRGSGVTQGAIFQHLRSLKQARLVAERPRGLGPLANWASHHGSIASGEDRPYWRRLPA
ncbi:hypothetical protein [Geminicoccus sp.]|uniref:hypothetical protein n=1 Tax=Geminicoccus sp. TaxID=2024832 RepID=UPI0032C21CF3